MSQFTKEKRKGLEKKIDILRCFDLLRDSVGIGTIWDHDLTHQIESLHGRETDGSFPIVLPQSPPQHTLLKILRKDFKHVCLAILGYQSIETLAKAETQIPNEYEKRHTISFF